MLGKESRAVIGGERERAQDTSRAQRSRGSRGFRPPKSEASADSSALELHRQRAKRSCARTQRVPRAKRLRLALVGSRLWCW